MSSPSTVLARSGAVDLVRVVGIVAVVIGHVWDNAVLDKVLYTWHVPVFFFLTGYFWSPGRTMAAELRNRFRTLVRPYLFWLVVILAFSAVLNHLRDDLTAADITGPLYGGLHATRPFSAFWFVTALFFAALAYRAIERVPDVARWAVIGSGLVAGIVAGDLLARLPLSIGTAWPCLVLISAGAGFRAVESRLRPPLLVGLLLLLGAAGLVAAGWSAPLDIKQGNYGTPALSVVVACAICAGLVLVAKQVFSHVPVGAHRAVTMLARAGFVVILSHAVVLMLLNTKATGGVDDFLLTLLAPWALGLLLIRTPLSAWAAGAERAGGSARGPRARQKGVAGRQGRQGREAPPRPGAVASRSARNAARARDRGPGAP